MNKLRTGTVTSKGILVGISTYYHPAILLHEGEKVWVSQSKDEKTAKIYNRIEEPWDGLARLIEEDKKKKKNKSHGWHR